MTNSTSLQKGEGDWSSLGLQQSPFTSTLRYALYFPVPGWHVYLEQLNAFINSKQLFGLVEGLPGMGKSCFLSQFLAHRTDSQLTVLLQGQTTQRADQLVEILLTRMDDQVAFQPQQPNMSFETRLQQFLMILQTRQCKMILIIDDAQRLPLETLAVLMCLIEHQSVQAAQLQILLFSELGLEKRLQQLLSQNINDLLSWRIKLTPLDIEQTREYLAHRLRKAGLPNQYSFSEIDIRSIFEQSQGIPGIINQIAESIVLARAKRFAKLGLHPLAKQDSRIPQSVRRFRTLFGKSTPVVQERIQP